jgi:glutamate-1-semialdehyde 2,1-aminomutase
MAIAASIVFTGRKKILVFSNAYHGSTISFPSGSAITTNLPHEFIIAPYNDIAGTKAILETLPRDSLAAILVEPIQGSAGCIVGSREFLHFLNTTAHSLGALFIVDEVMTSRLSYHGLSAALDLKPDLATLGKWVGGGMSFGAFGGRKDKGVMALFDPRTGVLAHSGTFNNNIITMAAGNAGLHLFTEDKLVALNELGEDLKKRVEDVLHRYKIPPPPPAPPKVKTNQDTIFEDSTSNSPPIHSLSLDNKRPDSGASEEPGMYITGSGSMLAVHFCGPSHAQLQHLFWHHMVEEGIYMAQRGFIALNLELKDEHVERFVRATEIFVGKYKVALGG